MALESRRRLAPSAVMAGVVFMLSCVLHLVHVALADWGADLLSAYAFSDAYYYEQAAWYRAFIEPSGGHMGQFIPNSPYVRALTLGYQVLGPGSATPFLVNGLLMSGAAAFVALIGFRLFGLGAGWLAGLGFMCSGLVVFFAGLTVKTNAELFFIAGSTYCFIRFLDTSTLWRLFLALQFMGLAVIDRNNYAVVLPVYAYLAWRHGFPGKSFFARIMVFFLAGGLALLLTGVVADWRSGEVEQKFLSPLGLNFYVGNAPGSRGTYTPVVGLRNDVEGHFSKGAGVVEGWLGRSLTRSEVSRFWFAKSWNYYRLHPLEYGVLQGRKAILLLASASYGLPEQLAVRQRLQPSLILAPVSYALVLALALAVLVCTTSWRGDPKAWAVVAGLILYTLSVWVFFVGERYRLPIFMLLLPFAAQGALLLWRVPSWRRRVPILAIVGALYGLSQASTHMLDSGPGWARDPERMAVIERGRLHQLQSFYRAQERAVLSNDPAAWHALASHALRRRFMGDAQHYAERAIAVAPDQVASYQLLARIHYGQGHRASLLSLAGRLKLLTATEQGASKWQGALRFVESLIASLSIRESR